VPGLPKTAGFPLEDEYDCPYKVSYPADREPLPSVLQAEFTRWGHGRYARSRCGDRKTYWTKNVRARIQSGRAGLGVNAAILSSTSIALLSVGAKAARWSLQQRTERKFGGRSLPSQEIGYSRPMIYEPRQATASLFWLSESINGLDPATGKVYWTQAYPSTAAQRRP